MDSLKVWKTEYYEYGKPGFQGQSRIFTLGERDACERRTSPYPDTTKALTRLRWSGYDGWERWGSNKTPFVGNTCITGISTIATENRVNRYYMSNTKAFRS